MKKFILLILFMNSSVLQADSNWAWEEERKHAEAELQKKKDAIAKAEEELKRLQNETDALKVKQVQIIKEIKTNTPKKIEVKKPVRIPNKYNLRINTVPKNAQYTLKDSKGRKVNYTWGMSLPKGKYNLKVWKKGYTTETKPITLTESKSVKVKLEKICKLRIDPNVSGATIRFTDLRYRRYLNRRYTENMTLTCNQSYFLKVSKRGYRTEKISTLMRRSQTNINVTLQRNVARQCRLKINPNVKNATVKIMNIKQRYRRNMLLECPRRYIIQVSKKGYKTRTFPTDMIHTETIPVKLVKK